MAQGNAAAECGRGIIVAAGRGGQSSLGDVMPDDPTLTDFLVNQARVSEHVTALILLLVKKGLITGPEYEAALREVVAVTFGGTERNGRG